MITNPAFELVRRHKEVTPETETLVLKQVKNKVSQTELINIFENGISGVYGKVYQADPQTLIGWVDKYTRSKHSDKNYLDTSLCDVNMNQAESWDWDKEANKCFLAYMSGVNENLFHPCVYDRMMIDGKIEISAYEKYYKIPDGLIFDSPLWPDALAKVKAAKQKILRDVFAQHKRMGWQTIYFIS